MPVLAPSSLLSVRSAQPSLACLQRILIPVQLRAPPPNSALSCSAPSSLRAQFHSLAAPPGQSLKTSSTGPRPFKPLLQWSTPPPPCSPQPTHPSSRPPPSASTRPPTC